MFTALPHVAAMAWSRICCAAGCRVVDLSADYRLRRSGRLRKMVRPRAHRSRPIGKDRLRPAGTVRRPHSAGRSGRQSRLLHEHVDPGAGSVFVPRADRAEGHHHRRQERRLRSRPHAEVESSLFASATKASRPIPSAIIATNRRSTRSCATPAARPVEVTFTPHLVPMDRGILCTMYARPLRSLAEADALETMRTFYDGKPFVRVVDHLPATKDCRIHELLPHDGPGRPAAGSSFFGDRQSDQRGRRRGRAEFQPDERLSRNDGLPR